MRAGPGCAGRYKYWSPRAVPAPVAPPHFSEETPQLEYCSPSAMFVVKSLAVVALLAWAGCAAAPQGPGARSPGQPPLAGDFSPLTGRHFGAVPQAEPGAYGYESEIPGARASFKAYRADPQLGVDNMFDYNSQALRSQGRPY